MVSTERLNHAPLCDHLSGRRVTAPLNATYPGLTVSPCETALMKTSSLPPSADGFVPTWSCSRRGLPGHLHYCKCRWSFTPPFHHHPLTPALLPKGEGRRGEGGCLFLWPSSGRLTPHGGVPRPGCYPTPCSMECGLSSIPTTQNRDRPTDLRHSHDTRKG